MSSLTKLLQEKRNQEPQTSALSSSLKGSIVNTRVPSNNAHGIPGTSPLSTVQDKNGDVTGATTVTQVDSNDDGSLDASYEFSTSFINANSAHTATMYSTSTPNRSGLAYIAIGNGNAEDTSRQSRVGSSHGKQVPSLSSSIPYSVPNSNAPTDSGNNSAESSVSSAWLEKHGSLPKNISAIDSNVISSPKVESVEPRFVISKQKLQQKASFNQEAQSGRPLSRSNSLSSQLGNFFFSKSKESASNTTSPSSGAGVSNSHTSAYSSSIPKPIRARTSSIYSSSRQPSSSYNDHFMGSPQSLHENPAQNQYIPRSRHSSVADLKRFFKKQGGNSSSYSDSPPMSSNFSNASANSSTGVNFAPSSLGSNDIVYSSSQAPTLPFSKRYSKTGENLGAGAGGSVKLVKRLADQKVFAVKEFRSKFDHETKRDYVKKITSEYCIGTTLRHPNIIATVEIVYENNRILQVMEYCDYDLFAIVMSNKMSYEEICCCFKQILVAVEYLHSIGLAHRDLKLDNCVINNQGIVKLIDFGAAVVFSYPHSRSLVESSGIVGSDPYLAPEVCIFTKYDPRPVDIWSVAIIFACMVLKKFPWKIPKLKDNSFKLFCSGRDCDSLSALVTKTPRPPSYGNVIQEDMPQEESPKSNNPSDPNNPNIGPQRLLHSLPEETHHIIERMVDLAPACRANIDEVLSDPWVQAIDMCTVHVDDQGGYELIPGYDHKHTQVDQSEAHIAGLEKKKKGK